jgi:glyoxylase-like metal-dependent hydrolase (beta-lactamase superfamily II)
MQRYLLASVAAFVFLATPVAAQTTQEVLQAAARNLGADNLRCITYTGRGYVGLVGQTFDIRNDWPRVELANYSRTINYDARTSREERTLRQGNYAAQGGGNMPLQGEQQQIQLVEDRFAWDMQGANANPAPAAAELRQLDIWMTPHGFLRGAMAPGANPVLITRYEGGALGGLTSIPQRKVNIISYTVLGKYRINGTISPDNFVERIQTRIPNPVRGDMNYEGEYSDWRDYGGVKFPSRWHHHQDWDDETQPPNYNGGHNRLDYTITGVRPNDCGMAVTAPANVRTAVVARPRVMSERLADGVHYLTGGTHHSVAVEFRDFVVLIEAPQNEARALALIETIYRDIPGKPIRYVVNTHHHFDHLGGLRTLFHEGATVVTHHSNRDFYKQEVLSHDPWTLEPDRLSLYPPTEFSEGYQFETVDIKYTITDGTKILDLYYVQGTPHSEGLLMAHLPRERILVEADVYTPPAANAAMPAMPPVASVNLYDNIKAYRLDVGTIAPLHGRAVPWADFLRYVQKTE